MFVTQHMVKGNTAFTDELPFSPIASHRMTQWEEERCHQGGKISYIELLMALHGNTHCEILMKGAFTDKWIISC